MYLETELQSGVSRNDVVSTPKFAKFPRKQSWKSTAIKVTATLPHKNIMSSSVDNHMGNDTKNDLKAVDKRKIMEMKLFPGSTKSKNSKYPRKQSRTSTTIRVQGTIPIERHAVFKWYGWGYKDSGFILKNGVARFTGERYLISGHKLPHMMSYIKEKLGIIVQGDINPETLEIPNEDAYLDSLMKQEEIEALVDLGITVSTKGIDRLVRASGQGHALAGVRNLTLERMPDAVAWPTCHEEIEKIVQLADQMNFVIIPFGGGTSVNNSLVCWPDETRSILSLDMSQMNEILSLSKENMTVTCETGIIGQDLERELEKMGYTTGHDPDSLEFSTLGGWISTRASGMKQNKYGNIEDLLVQAKMVTPQGVLSKQCFSPRVSCGPDLNHMILGSEGIFGVITEATIKIRPSPEVVNYGSIIFPDFNTGIDFLQHVALNRLQPASMRLLDEEQFKFGMHLQPEKSAFYDAMKKMKQMFVHYVKKFDPELMCMVTLVFEGKQSEVKIHEKKIYEIGRRYRGISAGSSTGEQGFLMTLVIAYVRDIALEFNMMGDTFETSVPWDKVKELVCNLRMIIQKQCLLLGIWKSVVMFRVAQSYDTGCCIYGYYTVPMPNFMDPDELYDSISELIRTEMIAMGGSISHHHGIGSCRTKYFQDFVSTTGVGVLLAAKNQLDPNNIFAAKNLLKDVDRNIQTPSKL